MQTGSPAGGVLGEMVHWCTWKSPSRNVFGFAEEYINVEQNGPIHKSNFKPFF